MTLRKILESELGPLTDAEFEELTDLVTTDIKVNNFALKKRTSLGYVIQVAEITLNLLRRTQVA